MTKVSKKIMSALFGREQRAEGVREKAKMTWRRE